MKKVLIVAYYFPPTSGSGSVRPAGLAKYLPEFGWEPIVITRIVEGRQTGPYRIVETPWRDVLQPLRFLAGSGRRGGGTAPSIAAFSKNGGWRRKAALAANALLAFPDREVGWYPFAVREALALVRREPVDAVLSSFSPGTSHLIAHRVRHAARVPWIADFRDLWTQSHYYPFGRLRRTVEHRLEKWVLRDATILVTVSQPLVEQLAQVYPGRDVRCIPNGFDPDEYVGSEPSAEPECLSVLYAGLLYEGRRDPQPLMAAMAQLVAEGKVPASGFRFEMYTRRENWLVEMVERFGLTSIAQICDWVPRCEILNRMLCADLLLLLTWNDPREEGVYTGKLFEYLGAGRAILATGFPRGVARTILEETKSGIFAESVDEIANVLLKAYLEKQATGCVSTHQDRQAALRYSHREMARQFAAALDDVTGRK